MLLTIAIWIGPGSVEALYPTSPAERMLGLAGVKGVGGEVVLPLSQQPLYNHAHSHHKTEHEKENL